MSDKLVKYVSRVIGGIDAATNSSYGEKKVSSVMQKDGGDIVIVSTNKEDTKNCTTYMCGLNSKNNLVLEIAFDDGTSIIQEESIAYNTIRDIFLPNVKNVITKVFKDSGFNVSLVENNTIRGSGFVCQIDIGDFNIDISITGNMSSGSSIELANLSCKYKIGSGNEWEILTGLNALIVKLNEIKSCCDIYSKPSKSVTRKLVSNPIPQSVPLPSTPTKSSQYVPEVFTRHVTSVPSSSSSSSSSSTSNNNNPGIGLRTSPAANYQSPSSQSSRSSQPSQPADLDDSFADSDDIDALYGRLASDDKICVREMWTSSFSSFKQKYSNRPNLMKFITTFQDFGEDCFRGFLKEWGVRQ